MLGKSTAHSREHAQGDDGRDKRSGRDGTNAHRPRQGDVVPRGGRFGPIVIAFVSVGLTVGLLEVLLHTVPGLMPTRVGERPVRTPVVAHSYIGHLHTPHSRLVVENKDFRVVHDTDGHGFRNTWPWPGRAEIVAVGDSLTFGYGVTASEAWPSVLARALPEVQLVNLGLVGASSLQYLRLYETFGAPLRPVVLLVGVFAQNDFWDAELFDRWLRSGAGGNYMEWRSTAPRAASSSGPSNTLVATIYREIQNTVGSTSLVKLVRHVLRERLDQPRYYRFPDSSQVRLLEGDFQEKTIGADIHRPEYRLVLDPLLELHQLARENGTRVVVVLLPSKEEVHLPLLGVAVKDPAQRLRQDLQQHGVDHVDLVSLFRARARAGHRLFFEEDGHPNAEGYALIAEGLLQHLRSHRYLEELPSAR